METLEWFPRITITPAREAEGARHAREAEKRLGRECESRSRSPLDVAFVPVVHTTFGAHDVGDSVQEQPVVLLDNSHSLQFHLRKRRGLYDILLCRKEVLIERYADNPR
ncbi:hypothetical protein NDU88_002614 [Pleurodeles waltl]|uniref:Uncharacterized protein n=1 Tax=Pleurodeles waltl TaxID=8319 RepID=A0AAV7Q9W4_PLEWA|nr:hypothetical protein NDU88_002614 [Pleurodeles waltl]